MKQLNLAQVGEDPLDPFNLANVDVEAVDWFDASLGDYEFDSLTETPIYETFGLDFAVIQPYNHQKVSPALVFVLDEPKQRPSIR